MGFYTRFRRILSTKTYSKCSEYYSTCKSPDPDLVAPGAERLEEREALDVIPVRVCEKEVGPQGVAVELLHQVVAQAAQAASCIEDHEPAAAVGDAQAGGIAAVTRSAGPGSGDRSPDAPEPDGVAHAGRKWVGERMRQFRLRRRLPSTATLTVKG